MALNCSRVTVLVRGAARLDGSRSPHAIYSVATLTLSLYPDFTQESETARVSTLP